MASTRITDGTTVVDIKNGESGFNYYLMVRPGGSGLILREKTDESEYRVSVFAGKDTSDEAETNVDAIFADRANRDYVRPSALKNL